MVSLSLGLVAETGRTCTAAVMSCGAALGATTFADQAFSSPETGRETDSGASGEAESTPKKVNGPSESVQWKELEPYRGKTKTSGEGKDRRHYEWDRTHNDIEIYDRKGNHLGSMETTTGKMYKPAVPGRKIDL